MTTTHVTYITNPDAAGHWGWECSECDANASGYDDPDEVLTAAQAHGPLAANSLIPVYDDED